MYKTKPTKESKKLEYIKPGQNLINNNAHGQKWVIIRQDDHEVQNIRFLFPKEQ